MFWLSSCPQFRRFQDFSVSTSSLPLEDNALEIDDNIMDEDLRRRTRPVRYLPSYSSSYWMWFRGRYITISRKKEENHWCSDKSTLHITSVSSCYINCLISERLTEYFPAIVLSWIPLFLRRGKPGCPKEATRSTFMPVRRQSGILN